MDYFGPWVLLQENGSIATPLLQHVFGCDSIKYTVCQLNLFGILLGETGDVNIEENIFENLFCIHGVVSVLAIR